jgi:predicted metal-dependent hydrolase
MDNQASRVETPQRLLTEPVTGIQYTLDYRDVKHPRLEFKTGTLQIILPWTYENEKHTLEKYYNWIRRKEDVIKKALERAKTTNINLKRTEKDLRYLIQQLAPSYQKNLGVDIKRILFRKMKTKWASYTTNGNLTINTLMKYLPEDIIRYILCHETAHAVEHKHNEHFWQIIAQRFPDYQTREKDLLMYWFTIQKKSSCSFSKIGVI